MQICASVVGCQVSEGAITLSLSVATTGGHEIGANVAVNLSQSAVQINNAIEQAAKDGLKNALGVVVTGQDTIRVFGGASL